MNDAYFTLSDPTRRRQYDATRQFRQTGTANTGGRPAGGWHDEQFGDIFEEMMNEEGFTSKTTGSAAAPTNISGGFRFWGIVGAVSGALLGFILACVYKTLLLRGQMLTKVFAL